MDLVDALYHKFARGLEPKLAMVVAMLAKTHFLDGGHRIVRQFERSADIILILEGEVVVTSYSGETLAIFGPGSVLGEVSLVDDQPRSANVTTTRPTTIAEFAADDLRAVMAEYPEIGSVIYRNLSEVLCTRLRVANMKADGAVVERFLR